VEVVKGKINPGMHKYLSEEFTRAEVYQDKSFTVTFYLYIFSST
jgi:hypothetical protein